MLPLLPILLPSWLPAVLGVTVAYSLARGLGPRMSSVWAGSIAVTVGWSLVTVLPALGIGAWAGLATLPTQAVLIGLGLVAAWRWWLRRLPVTGCQPRAALCAGLLALLAALVGGRLWYAIEFHAAPAPSAGQPLVLYGCLLAGMATLIGYLHFQQQPWRAALDAAVAPSFLVLALGRLGCWLGGCCYGLPSSLPWAVQGNRSLVPEWRDGRLAWTWQDSFLVEHESLIRPALGLAPGDCGLARHPTQIYEAAAAVVLLVATTWAWQRPWCRRHPGVVLAAATAVYGGWRFLNESWRGDNPPLAGGWSASAWCSVLLMLTGMVLLVWWTRRSGDEL